MHSRPNPASAGVCDRRECGTEGSLELSDKLRQGLKDASGRQEEPYVPESRSSVAEKDALAARKMFEPASCVYRYRPLHSHIFTSIVEAPFGRSEATDEI